MLSIEELNGDCLLKIFQYLPINDLLRLDLVHSEWQKYKDEICSGRTVLQINDNTDGEHKQWLQLFQHNYQNIINIPQNTISLECIDLCSVQLLLTTFPNISSLVLAVSVLDQLTFSVILELAKKNLKLLILSTESSFMFENHSIPIFPKLEHLLIKSPRFNVDKVLEKTVSPLKSFVENCQDSSVNKELLFNKLSSRIHTISLKLDVFLSLLNRPKPKLQSIQNPIILYFKKQEKEMLKSFLEMIPRKDLVSLTFEKGQNKSLIIDEKILEIPLSCLIINMELFRVSDYFNQNLNLTTLKLIDGDFEPNIFTNLLFAFPNIKSLSLDCSRICCECTEDEILANQQQNPPALPQNPQPDAQQPQDSLQNQLQNPENPQPQPNMENPPAINPQNLEQNPPNNPNPAPIEEEEPEEVIYVTCDVCSRKVIDSISSLSFLQTFICFGSNCNSEIINGLYNCENIELIDFLRVDSGNYSLKNLLQMCYQIGKNRPNKILKVVIDSKLKTKIIRLPKNCDNVRVLFE